MGSDQQSSQSSLRANLLLLLLVVFMFLWISKLFFLQIIKHDDYLKKADQSQVKKLTIPAKRGVIYVLDNQQPVPLVLNQKVYLVFADPKIIKNKEKIIQVMKQVAGGELRPDFEKLLDKKETRYQIIASKITRGQAEMIKKEGLKGIGFQEMTQRVYPEGSMASQVLGFVDLDGVGRYGIEGHLDQRLKGEDGLLQSVTDPRDVPLTIGSKNIRQAPKNGDNLVLSLDRNIQARVETALSDALVRSSATHASAVIMNPHNGQILAMANLPTYSPAEYYKTEDISLFNNPVISQPYEPGSDIKTLTMAVGIDKGVVSPSDTYFNRDVVQVDDRRITNADKGRTGEISYQTALNYSLNTGFVDIAFKLGDGKYITRGARNTIYDYFYNRFKLGQVTGVELAGEVSGVVISPEKTEGNAVRYSNMVFGQGMDITMLQTTSAFASIVNGGKYYQPTILAGVVDDQGKYQQAPLAKVVNRTISSNTAEKVREMIHVARATFHSNQDKAGYYVGGKTGTSQIVKDGVYSDEETVATYLGFGGSKDRTEYVIMVQVSGEGRILTGARDALPIFTDISNWLLDYLKIKPKG